MNHPRTFSHRRRGISVAAGISVGLALMWGIASPALAALSNTSWVMSNNQVSSSSTYTTIFSTGSPSVTDLVLMLPAGVTGLSASNVSVSTASSCTGTFSTLTPGTAVLSPTSNPTSIGLPVSIATAGTCVKVVVTGLTNPSTAGTVYGCLADGTDTVTTDLSTYLGDLSCGSGGISSTSLTSTILDALVTDNVSVALTYLTQAINGVTTDLNVAPVLNFNPISNYQSFDITPTPNGAEVSNSTQALTVSTNAQSYTIEGLVAGPTSALTWAGYTGTGTAPSIPFGYTEATGSSLMPSCSSSSPAFGANGTYSNITSLTGLTNGQTTNINYCWSVDYTKPAGLYQGTVTYLVVPSF